MNGLARLVRPLPPIDMTIAASPLGLVCGLDLTLSYAPVPKPRRISSRSSADRYHVMLAGADVIGVDIETLDRIAANATAEDGWLGREERRLVERSPSPVLELACHWVLKEAYGKAIGVGLALPLAMLRFADEDGRVALTYDGDTAQGWRFALYHSDALVVGIAHRHAATSFAPAGRKPPTPSLDR